MTESTPIPETQDPMSALELADPVLAREIRTMLPSNDGGMAGDMLRQMATDTINALAVEVSFGYAVGRGYAGLINSGVGADRTRRYGDIMREAGAVGPTFGRTMAGALVDILKWGDAPLIEGFLIVAGEMKAKWLYAFTEAPLVLTAELIGPDDLEAGRACIGLLRTVFSHDLTYNQYRRFTAKFPRMIREFPPSRRAWRINQLERVVRRDFNLGSHFLDAFENGVSFLDKESLAAFVSEGLVRYDRDPERGERFLSLQARSAIEACEHMRRSVVFPEIQQPLSRYLQARFGRPVTLRPLSALPDVYTDMMGNNRGTGEDEVYACCDGRRIYLADEIRRHPQQKDNYRLYKALAWVEAGLLEFGTFHFDLERAMAACGMTVVPMPDDDGTDIHRFCHLFAAPSLALDLFTVFEYGRVRTRLETVYPAGAARFFGLLREAAEMALNSRGASSSRRMDRLHAMVSLGCDEKILMPAEDGAAEECRHCIGLFERYVAGRTVPEASAVAVSRVFDEASPDVFSAGDTFETMRPPYGLRVRPDLFTYAFYGYERRAADIKQQVAEKGASIYKSDILRRMTEQGGLLYASDIREMAAAHEGTQAATAFDMSGIDINGLEHPAGDTARPEDAFHGNTYRYREWDATIDDYLHDHVLVRERELSGTDESFYRQVLMKRQGLVKKIRYAFELLKPEGVSVLRKWPEGEEFDHSRLIAFAVDKKMGRTPSERIYIKRIKQERDVAVQLLVDFSKSTSNMVAGGGETTVLDVEKEAMVLFCEALSVVGDPFAIAGFSGTGRLGVDYFIVKKMDQPMGKAVQQGIGGVRPHRNTRMGAAIRHATAGFDNVLAKSRLMIIISDGFPNDIDYKREYAMTDTRRALLEARAKNIAVHAITVNIAGDATLDDLYGRVRHSVIADVRELPDKLLRIYGRLTA
ncbi:MAG: hypothetical protein SWH68_15820 [Thermodesulfobacteriota bacterium]|nr:hypothetical protein [Thermodesulfobacteriota bacterium]